MADQKNVTSHDLKWCPFLVILPLWNFENYTWSLCGKSSGSLKSLMDLTGSGSASLIYSLTCPYCQGRTGPSFEIKFWNNKKKQLEWHILLSLFVTANPSAFAHSPRTATGEFYLSDKVSRDFLPLAFSYSPAKFGFVRSETKIWSQK